jgi:carbonic anhydrase/acetyltransferase-like protein (isoleucine patch superfamily)
MIIEYESKQPKIGAEVFIAPTAVVIGDVSIGDGSSIWFGAVLRGDEGTIIIGKNTNVQDNAVIHTTVERSTQIGDNVTVGHGSLLEGCTIESGAVIGMGAVLLEDVIIGKQAMVAAGSVVVSGTIVPSRMLAAGIPAVVKKKITGASLRSLEIGVPIYRKLSRRYREQKLSDPFS